VKLCVEAYRCSTCGNSDSLIACASAVVSGPLGADLDVLAESVETCELFDSSVACVTHGEGSIERKILGVWSIWSPCVHCSGSGAVGEYGWRCPTCGGEGGSHEPAPTEVAL